MTESNENASIIITLTVARVDFGGNTGKGEYFYSFSPDLLLVGKGQQDVTLVYRFDVDVPYQFRIRSLLSSDAHDQLEEPEIADDGRSVSVLNRNNKATLIFLTVIIEDEKRKLLFSCDPQVGNDPQISPQ
ncbi:hypothetical protein ABQZ69_17830 [Xanthomonas sp. WHRI 8391]|uniref:Uncharacterized protein n=1 Tax=Xanthomonas hortorum pv. carotae TaxID=487904 RepID=A0A6V7BLT0_9XANT|nr:hypothetical protein [Xanthomonas hortorum]ETC90303.1 hypothetical protein XHC_0146 [Xanthomonas hortorum pv. carotae str. M081]MBG3851378.1 hypothetical protein [Xanthomonas hortorum pv. carotae]UTS74225.1 hypothetical protein NMB96_05120 [Xanthomonas hortorum]CAD0303214.1 hypothetical protein CFBP7900_01930 [Xanthomonas hortorum pv. carotae]CAD0303220.1 hypothetical protein CFBP7900_01930 [Xanthomonas hortorum pv. carotae]